MRKILIIVIVTIVSVIAVFTFFKFSKVNIENLFKAKPITIDKTANVIEEIRQLAELTTATYYQDIVIKKVKKSAFFDDELVMITKGKVRAGYDMSNLTEQDIVIDSSIIKIKLPKVKVLDIITNPSDFDTYVETGKWTFEEVTEYKKEAREKLKKNAIEGGILELAERSAFEKLSSLFQAFGFKEVIIE